MKKQKVGVESYSDNVAATATTDFNLFPTILSPEKNEKAVVLGNTSDSTPQDLDQTKEVSFANNSSEIEIPVIDVASTPYTSAFEKFMCDTLENMYQYFFDVSQHLKLLAVDRNKP